MSESSGISTMKPVGEKLRRMAGAKISAKLLFRRFIPKENVRITPAIDLSRVLFRVFKIARARFFTMLVVC